MNDIEIARDDLALDALAAGREPEGGDEVLGLLAAFRADVEPPAPNVVPLRPRRRRPGALIALSAAAGLILGGITAGAVVTSDQPGELLYAAHKAVLGDPREAGRVARLIDEAAEEIAEGDLEKARDRLDKATERLGEVEDPAERAALRDRIARLRALVAPSSPQPSASPDDDGTETPEPRESESEDSSGKGSGSDDSGSGSDSSGKGSSGSGGSDDD
jgi:uncharacterized membrane protein YgcG